MRKFIERALNKLDRLDATQVRSLLHDLAGENERLEQVLESLDDGILVTDVEHRVIMHNKSSERLLPLSFRDGAEGMIWDVILDSDIAGFVQRNLQNQESVADMEFALDYKGMQRILAISLLPLVHDGHIQGSILHVEDVSEKRGRDARLRRAESLASLTTLAAGVAHEIKNPLGSMGIHLQLIEKQLSQEEGFEGSPVSQYLTIINEEVERLNKIVVDFLFAVRPMDIELHECDLNVTVGELLRFVQFELDQANIELATNLDESLPHVMLDEKYFKQALLNMIKNAISAMPQGGVLSVSTSQHGNEALLRLSDTGTGIDDSVLDKIFEPYFTTKDFGSGIGLTLVYKVVKEHMGEISVISQKGKGTTFTVVLPIPQHEQHLLDYQGGQG